jgi:hypothetical protein
MKERLLNLWDRIQNDYYDAWCYITPNDRELHVSLFLQTGEPNWLKLVFTDNKNRMDANDLIYVRNRGREKINDLWARLHFADHLDPMCPFITFKDEGLVLELIFFQPEDARGRAGDRHAQQL